MKMFNSEITALRKLDMMKTRARPIPFKETWEAKRHQEWKEHSDFMVESNFAIARAIMAVLEKQV